MSTLASFMLTLAAVLAAGVVLFAAGAAIGHVFYSLARGPRDSQFWPAVFISTVGVVTVAVWSMGGGL